MTKKLFTNLKSRKSRKSNRHRKSNKSKRLLKNKKLIGGSLSFSSMFSDAIDKFEKYGIEPEPEPEPQNIVVYNYEKGKKIGIDLIELPFKNKVNFNINKSYGNIYIKKIIEDIEMPYKLSNIGVKPGSKIINVDGIDIDKLNPKEHRIRDIISKDNLGSGFGYLTIDISQDTIDEYHEYLKLKRDTELNKLGNLLTQGNNRANRDYLENILNGLSPKARNSVMRRNTKQKLNKLLPLDVCNEKNIACQRIIKSKKGTNRAQRFGVGKYMLGRKYGIIDNLTLDQGNDPEMRSGASYNGGSKILYHATSSKIIELILSSGIMKAGKYGLMGAGIYFCDNPQLCCRKALAASDGEPLQIIVCLVFMGRTQTVNTGTFSSHVYGRNNNGRKVNFESLLGRNIDSIEFLRIDPETKMSGGTEYIVYDSKQCVVLGTYDQIKDGKVNVSPEIYEEVISHNFTGCNR